MRLEVQQVSRLDFTLQVGAVTETIEVTAATPMLESSNASVGQVVETQAINDLPLNGRNYLDLAKLWIGVTEPTGNDQPGDWQHLRRVGADRSARLQRQHRHAERPER